MAQVTIRHLIERVYASRTVYYWSPSASLKALGYKLVSLGDDRSKAIVEAEKLNALADQRRQQATEVRRAETVSHLIASYYEDRSFQKLASKTQYEYRRHCEAIREFCGDAPARSITRRVVQSWYAKRAETAPAQAAAAVRVLRILFHHAMNLGWVTENPAKEPRIYNSPNRDVVWSDDDVRLFVVAADALGLTSIGTAVLLGYELGQRQGDILTLRYDALIRAGGGMTARIRQSKTKALVDAPVTPALYDRLERDRAARSGAVVSSPFVLLSEATMRPWGQTAFNKRFREILVAAKLRDELQFLDLRRSCVVRLAEAGCTVPEITAITGHDVDRAAKILERYMPRNSEMAKAAVTKREAKRRAATQSEK